MDTTNTAYIAAGSALAGAAIGAGSAFGIELWRARASQRKEAADRLLDALADTLSGYNDWADNATAALKSTDANVRARLLSDADAASARGGASKVRLTLVASSPLLEWLDDTYEPAMRKLSVVVREALNGSPQNIQVMEEEYASLMAVIADASDLLREAVEDVRSGKV